MRVITVLSIALGAAAWGGAPAQRLTPIPFHEVAISDPFWKKKIEVNRTATIEACLKKCEETGRLRNFAVAARLVEGEHQGCYFNDSDVYKLLEAIAYSLHVRPDPELEARADRIIDWIAAAQQDDGYLYTFITLKHPDQRWQNIRNWHELYCAGHLIEAAIAYHQATGKRKLLDVAIRFADLIDREFGPGKRHDPPGHQELELALVKLFRATGQRRYLELAEFFLERRGRLEGRMRLFGKYCQDHKPVREQFEVEGHAVRAMYQFCAMTDVAAETGDPGLITALDRLWHDVVDRKMYVTGGIGDSASNEGFTGPYILPNETAYAETCAAIGMALWNHRLFLMTGEGKYMDVVEREILNGLISGVSVTGDRFFYPNRLASLHGQKRVPWFNCSCCPVNIARYVPAMGERVYAGRSRALYVALYIGSATSIDLPGGIRTRVSQKTDYPWSGVVNVTIDPAEAVPLSVRFRRPGWCEGEVKITVNGRPADASLDRGFLTLSRTWQPETRVRLEFPMPVRRVHADPRVKADVGRVALVRGPVVFCLEAEDHDGRVRNIFLPEDAELTARFDADFFGGATVIEGEARAVVLEEGERVVRPVKIRAIPYHLWANRTPGQMVVWIPESADLAEAPGEEGRVMSQGAALRASHCWEHDTLTAMNDGRLPESSADKSLPRMTFWPRQGTTEWVEYGFTSPRKIATASVYWFDDTGTGRCRVPAAWRLLFLAGDGTTWKPVELTSESKPSCRRDTFNRVRFKPVETRVLRLEVELQKGFSGGIREWRVE